MYVITRFLLPSLLGVFFCGCSANSLYFAESTRFALAVDLKPDASEPINTTLGYKRHIAAVVPARGGQTAGSDEFSGEPLNRGEALSLVSKFDVYPEAKVEGNPNSNGLVIAHNFASGRAADALTAGTASETGERVEALMRPVPQVNQVVDDFSGRLAKAASMPVRQPETLPAEAFLSGDDIRSRNEIRVEAIRLIDSIIEKAGGDDGWRRQLFQAALDEAIVVGVEPNPNAILDFFDDEGTTTANMESLLVSLEKQAE